MDPGSIWALWNLIKYLAPHQTQFLCLYPRRELQGRNKKTFGWIRGTCRGLKRKKDCPVVLSLHLRTLVSCARTQCPWALWCSAEVVIVITAMDKKAHANIHPVSFSFLVPSDMESKHASPEQKLFPFAQNLNMEGDKKATYTTKCA